jgi:Flp pilus assembly protein TadD
MSTNPVWQDYFAGRHDAVLQAGASAAETMHVTGLSLVALGRYDEAFTLLLAAVSVSPAPAWFCNSMSALLDAGQLKLAESLIDAADEECPDHPAVNFMIGHVRSALGHLHGAEEHYHVATNREPENWEYAFHHANAQRRLGYLDAALEGYEHALTVLGSGNLDAFVRINLNRAVTHSDRGEYKTALQMFDSLAKLPINSPELDFNRATHRLRFGHFGEGWELYERRWECAMSANSRTEFVKPFLPSLADAKDKHVLFCHEQGFGDSIQFVRYAPLLAEHAGKVTILVPWTLKALFETLGLPVVTSRDEVGDYDFELPMLSAPRLFNTTLKSIPPAPYLSVPDVVNGDGHKLRVGLIWAGQARPGNPELQAIDEKRSIPKGTMLNLMLGLERQIDFVNLQYDPDDQDHYFQNVLAGPDCDFLYAAKWIAGLDLLITVDTAGAHLAGALGKPVWMLSRFDGCWRWLDNRDDSPWYPTMHIIHQQDGESWEKVVLGRVSAMLEKMIDSK